MTEHTFEPSNDQLRDDAATELAAAWVGAFQDAWTSDPADEPATDDLAALAAEVLGLDASSVPVLAALIDEHRAAWAAEDPDWSNACLYDWVEDVAAAVVEDAS